MNKYDEYKAILKTKMAEHKKISDNCLMKLRLGYTLMGISVITVLSLFINLLTHSFIISISVAISIVAAVISRVLNKNNIKVMETVKIQNEYIPEDNSFFGKMFNIAVKGKIHSEAYLECVKKESGIKIFEASIHSSTDILFYHSVLNPDISMHILKYNVGNGLCTDADGIIMSGVETFKRYISDEKERMYLLNGYIDKIKNVTDKEFETKFKTFLKTNESFLKNFEPEKFSQIFTFNSICEIVTAEAFKKLN